MKNKLISLLLIFVMGLSIIPLEFAEAIEGTAGLENFTKTNTYVEGQFSDVKTSDWFAENVVAAYEYGLVKGSSATTFNPTGKLTVAETIALACRLHNIYNGGDGNFTQGSPWYQVYVDYARENDIISGGYLYDSAITRFSFVNILSNALPKETLNEINTIENGKIPDVDENSINEPIYLFYRAGILTGSDKYGTFNPDSNIQRSEVATIVTRMADNEQRRMFTLQEKPLEPESVTLTGKTSINVGETTQWKAIITPNEASQQVSWTSGNPGVATVDANGNIKGLKDGQSNITVTTENGIKKTVLLTVGVLNPTAIALAGATTINVGETTQWKAAVTPSGANQWVQWVSGNPSVATVDANGNIKGLKAGQSNITAIAINGVKKTVLLNVMERPSLQNISIDLSDIDSNKISNTNPKEITLELGETVRLKRKLIPAYADDSHVVWGCDVGFERFFSVSEADDGSYMDITAHQLTDAYDTIETVLMNADNYNIEYDSVEIKIVNPLPKIIMKTHLPGVLHKYASDGSTKENYKITDFNYKLTDASGGMFYGSLYFNGEKIFDVDGADDSHYCTIDWKLYDEGGYVVGSGTCLTSNLSVGDKFEDEVSSVSNLKSGATYYLELINADENEAIVTNPAPIIIVKKGLNKTLNEYYSGVNKRISSHIVSEFRYELKKASDGTYYGHLYFSGNKMFDINGSGQSRTCRVGWKLYDTNDNVIDSGICYTAAVAENESFIDASSSIFNLHSGTYYLELIDIN